ncbi:hypothetical protein ASU31_13350 [Pedobacter ginsenosidimutans]|uniref:DUF4280 domain-containing protein n=1 Tax=Pedobacter ginsenosidimutans TaxID=687842 RepID=A0A0T5VPB1_9SPHI|nr:PAAR-like protein [Pedobacter ginsenosidimutans]KRT15645.1 hypothetical protein ASU31_13350 [Pedobacter ginsenosidimutans]
MAKIYVPDQTYLVCSDGMSKQQLKVGSQSTIKIAGGRLAGTIDDRMGGNFNCAKMVVAGAIIGAIVAGLIAAATVATGGVAGALIIGAIAAGGAAGGAALGLGAGFMPCICALLTSGSDWAPVHPKVLIEKKKALIESSKVGCFFGGQVMIFYSEKAADEAIDLKRKKTLTDVGLVMASAFVAGGAFQGIAGAFSTGSTVLATFGKVALAEYVGLTLLGGAGAYGADFVLSKGKEEAYQYAGVKEQIDGYETDITVINEKIANHEAYTSETVLDQGTKGVDAAGKGHEVSKQNISGSNTYVAQDYARLNDIEEYGQTRTYSSVDPNAIQGNNPQSERSYNQNTHFSDETGSYSDGQVQHVTTNNQWSRLSRSGAMKGVGQGAANTFKDYKGFLLGLIPDLYKYITNPFVKDEIQDYIKAMVNDEAKAKAGVNVIETDI